MRVLVVDIGGTHVLSDRLTPETFGKPALNHDSWANALIPRYRMQKGGGQ